jgi:hypothetical protein
MTNNNPMQTLKIFGILLFACIAWTVFVPGFIANCGGVFYEDQLHKLLPKAAATSLNKYRDDQKIKQIALQRIETAIIETASMLDKHNNNIANTQLDISTLGALMEAKAKLRAEIDIQKPPISAIPFYLNPQLWLWPAIYVALGTLVFVTKPFHRSISTLDTLRLKQFVWLTISIYILYEWPLWMRNFLFSDSGRKVFAYPNIDIHPASFFMQEAVILGFCALVATLWITELSRTPHSATRKNHIAITLDKRTARSLSRMLFEWQYRSVVLACGFGFFSNFFWQLVFKYNDQRYVISAINAHILWAISWITISLPLIRSWQKWEEARATAVVSALADENLPVEAREKIAKSLSDLRPGGFGSLFASVVVAAVSFVLPIAKEIIK